VGETRDAQTNSGEEPTIEQLREQVAALGAQVEAARTDAQSWKDYAASLRDSAGQRDASQTQAATDTDDDITKVELPDPTDDPKGFAQGLIGAIGKKLETVQAGGVTLQQVGQVVTNALGIYETMNQWRTANPDLIPFETQISQLAATIQGPDVVVRMNEATKQFAEALKGKGMNVEAHPIGPGVKTTPPVTGIRTGTQTTSAASKGAEPDGQEPVKLQTEEEGVDDLMASRAQWQAARSPRHHTPDKK
jgi:hypothetical protein